MQHFEVITQNTGILLVLDIDDIEGRSLKVNSKKFFRIPKKNDKRRTWDIAVFSSLSSNKASNYEKVKARHCPQSARKMGSGSAVIEMLKKTEGDAALRRRNIGPSAPESEANF